MTLDNFLEQIKTHPAKGKTELKISASFEEEDYFEKIFYFKFRYSVNFLESNHPNIYSHERIGIEEDEDITKRVNERYEEVQSILNEKGIHSEIKDQNFLLIKKDTQTNNSLDIPEGFYFYDIADNIAPLLKVNRNKVMDYVLRRTGEDYDLSNHYMSLDQVFGLFNSLRKGSKRSKEEVRDAITHYISDLNNY